VELAHKRNLNQHSKYKRAVDVIFFFVHDESTSQHRQEHHSLEPKISPASWRSGGRGRAHILLCLFKVTAESQKERCQILGSPSTAGSASLKFSILWKFRGEWSIKTIALLDQWSITIENHWNQWLNDPNTIEKPLKALVMVNSSDWLEARWRLNFKSFVTRKDTSA